MREIKFRAWTGEKMSSWNDMKKLHIHTVFVMCQPELNLMQYTGLKDKNGVEIYEGDVLQQKGQVHRVDFDQGSFGMRMLHVGLSSFLTIYPDNVEVVGNIYENPDL